MCNVFINKVQLAFGNEEGIVSLCLNDDTTVTKRTKDKGDYYGLKMNTKY